MRRGLLPDHPAALCATKGRDESNGKACVSPVIISVVFIFLLAKLAPGSIKKIVVSSRKAVSSTKVTSFALMKLIENEMVKSKQECVSKVRPITDALYVLNGKWKLPLIFTLRQHPQRFNEILKSVEGITPKVLAKELRDLESNEFIVRKVFPTTPVTVIYESTTYSDSLQEVLQALYNWGDQHREKIKQSMRITKQA